MKYSKEILDLLGWSNKSEDFVIGTDSFSDLQVNPTPAREKFYFFYDKKNRRLIKQFILKSGERVDYICQVTLIKKDEKFTPRLALSVRDKSKAITQEEHVEPANIKANVNLGECHENFWKLVAFMQSLREIEIPQESFSLVSQGDAEIVSALQGRARRALRVSSSSSQEPRECNFRRRM